MRVLLAAGGTGGHVTPAIATAEAIVDLMPSASVLFLTDGRPVAEKFFSRVRFGRELLFPDHATSPRKYEVVAWSRALSRARALIRDFEPDVVAGFGGYPTFLLGVASLGSLPVALRRWFASSKAETRSFPSRAPDRPPLVLLEQNACPGRSVKIFSRTCSRVLLSLDDARSRLPPEVASETTGNPLPREFGAEPAPARPEIFGLEPGKTTLLVLGGSQGARGVNKLVLAARPELARRFPELQILFITGDLDFAAVKEEIARAPSPRTIVLPFEHRMRRAYEAADVVVCRAGGTTLAELAIVGRPMVVVPYPHHRDQHQLQNARAFERIGAARIVEEGEGADSKFALLVAEYLSDPALRDRAARAALTLGRPDAARAAAKRILEVGGFAGAWN